MRRENRLRKIERKCDRILHQIGILRAELKQSNDIDTLITKMHNTAKSMLDTCERERAESIRQLARRINT